jgi:decaprenylphospho-beta-D-erythro-pentofuranosid-2-ulose 2-reductase
MKRILIIGATSAIAAACARRWAQQGACLCLLGRNQEKLAAIQADLSVRGAAAVSLACLDVLDLQGQQSALAKAFADLGKVDVVLLAAGSLPDQHACEKDPALAAAEFTLNATALIALLGHLANQLEAQGHGHLAVLTSVAGDRGRRSNHLYGSAKAALQTYLEGLQARLRPHGVGVTDIRPGFVATPMTAHLKFPALLQASPAAVAGAILRGIRRGRVVIYAPFFWRWIMLMLRILPRGLFSRLKI